MGGAGRAFGHCISARGPETHGHHRFLAAAPGERAGKGEDMKLAERFKDGGMGVMATAGSDGAVNTAVYAVPHIVDEETVAWGMTEGRTHRFAKENPHASFLFFAPGGQGKGVRLTLALKNIETTGKLLEKIRARVSETVNPQAGAAMRYVVYFRVVETRPLY